MSSYSSQFTGLELEEAIDQATKIKQWVKVWEGVALGSLNLKEIKINPDTNDRVGLYKVIGKHDALPLDYVVPTNHKGGFGAVINFIELRSEKNHSMGTSTSWIAEMNNVGITSLDVNGIDGTINLSWSQENPRVLPPEETPKFEGADGVVRTDLYIRELWRYQTVQPGDKI